MSAQQRIAILGLFACGNIGDEALWLSASDALDEMLPANTQLSLVTYGPGGFAHFSLPRGMRARDSIVHSAVLPHQSARSLTLRGWLSGGIVRFLKLLSSFDALWYSGGHWLHDLSLVTLGGVLAPVYFGRILGKSAGFINVGAGPLSTHRSHLLIKPLRYGRGPLSLRDKYSYDLTTSVLGDQRAKQSADLALTLEVEVKDAKRIASEDIPTDCSRTVAISPCAWFKLENIYQPRGTQIDAMEEALAKLVAELRKRELEVLFIPTMLPEDRETAQRVNARLGPTAAAPILNTEAITARRLCEIIGSLKLIVSFRMHPALFAIITGTKVIALNYAPKVESLMKQFSLEQYLITLDERWNETLLTSIDRVLLEEYQFPDRGVLQDLRNKARSGIENALTTLS